MFLRIFATLPLGILLLAEVNGISPLSHSNEVSRGHSSQQYHYTSYGNGQNRPSQFNSAVDSVAADPTYALYLAVGFVVLLGALGYIIYPILSEKIPAEGSKGERSFRGSWNTEMTHNILSAIENVYENYKDR